ncbi:MAG: hypothetical protein GY906_22730 [bacterium]|nr:hypothetical protein [bacterium]
MTELATAAVLLMGRHLRESLAALAVPNQHSMEGKPMSETTAMSAERLKWIWNLWLDTSHTLADWGCVGELLREVRRLRTENDILEGQVHAHYERIQDLAAERDEAWKLAEEARDESVMEDPEYDIRSPNPWYTRTISLDIPVKFTNLCIAVDERRDKRKATA